MMVPNSPEYVKADKYTPVLKWLKKSLLETDALTLENSGKYLQNNLKNYGYLLRSVRVFLPFYSINILRNVNLYISYFNC